MTVTHAVPAWQEAEDKRYQQKHRTLQRKAERTAKHKRQGR